MAGVIHGMPTEQSPAGDIARRLAAIIGPAYQAPDGSLNACDFLAYGDTIAQLVADMSTVLMQSTPSTATVLLSEWEEQFGLSLRTDLDTADRRARLVAKIRAKRSASPDDILTAVAAFDATATLVENTIAHVLATNPRGVFVFAVIVAVVTFDNPVALAAIKSLVAQMKQSHTQGWVGTRVGFLCDDPNSLTDRDVLT